MLLIAKFVLLIAMILVPSLGVCQQTIEPSLAIPESRSNSSKYSWPRLLGSQSNGSVSTDLQFDWTATPERIWSLAVGEGYGLGSVGAGQYYHFDSETIAGELHERLRSIDLATGRPLRQHSRPIRYRDLYGYENGPRSTPTHDSQYVFTYGVSGELVCRLRDSLQVVWAIDTNERYGVVQNFFGVGSSLLLLDKLVIVIVGGSPAEDARIAPGRLDRVSPNGSAVVAFDRESGEESWRCGDDLASYSSPLPIVLEGKTYVLAFTRNGLLCIDPVLGKVVWSHDHRAELLESVNAMTPVVDGNEVLISECYQLGSVLLRASAERAEVIWKDPPFDRRRQAMRAHWSTPILIDGFLYGCSGRNAPDSDFRCIEWKTGQVQWTESTRTRSSVTRVNDYLIQLEERGAMRVIKATPQQYQVVAEWDFDSDASETGERTGELLRYPCWAAPIVVGDKMLVRGDKHVLCFQLRVSTTN